MNWEELTVLIQNAPNRVTVEAGGASPEELEKLGISRDSALGQVMRRCSRLTVSGYFRLHGAQIPEMTRAVTALWPGNKTVVATDVWGGVFAIGNGDFPGNPDLIWYHAPDTLEWEPMRIGYEKFLEWMCSRRFFEYHSTFVWKNMEELLSALKADQGVLPSPPLWDASGEERNRWQVVSFEHLLKTIAET